MEKFHKFSNVIWISEYVITFIFIFFCATESQNPPTTQSPSASCTYVCSETLTFESGSSAYVGFNPPTNGIYENGVIKGCTGVYAEIVCNVSYFFNFNTIQCGKAAKWIGYPTGESYESIKFCGDSCEIKCMTDLNSISLQLPEQVTFTPPFKGVYQNGELMGCIGTSANLECGGENIYFGTTNTTNVTLDCTASEKWLFHSNNEEVKYLAGCSVEPPCIMVGNNYYDLQLVAKDAGMIYNSNDSADTFFLMGLDLDSAKFICPSPSQRVFVNEKYSDHYTVTCDNSTFGYREDLPPCYEVDPIDGTAVEDPKKQCSNTPKCFHYMVGTNENVTFGTDKGYFNDSGGIISFQACIGNKLFIKCKNPNASLWVMKSDDCKCWIYLAIKSITAKCNEIPKLKDVFLMKSSLKNYTLLSNTSEKFATYECVDPLTDELTTTTDLSTTTTISTETSSPATSTPSTLESTPSTTLPKSSITSSLESSTSSSAQTSTTTQQPITSTISNAITTSTTNQITNTVPTSQSTNTPSGATETSGITVASSTTTLNAGSKSSSSTKSAQETTSQAVESQYTPVVPLDGNEKPYKDTADYQCSEIETCFKSSDGQSGFTEVKGPPGFGVAAGLGGSKCRVKEGGFDSDTNTCLMNPKSCSESGLSFSIWEKHFNYENILTDPSRPTGQNNSDFWYIISTGGDMNGHPGFALYHHKHYIVAVVSTGDQYWTVDAVAQSEAGCWVNIGVVWDSTRGIRLYFNATKFGESSYARNVTAMSSLNPPVIMLGCHKTAANSVYGGFNPNCSMDEFSFWRHYLVDTPTDKEVLKMLGGYRESYASKSPTELQKIIDNTDPSDPAQVASAANIAALVLDEGPSSTSSTTPSTGPSSTASTPTDDDPNGSNFENRVKTAMSFMNPIAPANPIDMTDLQAFMSGEKFMADLLDEKNQAKWNALQLKQDIYGAAQMIEAYRSYQNRLLRKIKLHNGTSKYCSKNDYGNMYNRACKMTKNEFLSATKNGLIRRPLEYPLSYRTNWNLPFDVAAVYASLFTDEECMDRAVSVSFTMIDSAAGMMHMGINPARMKYAEYFFDVLRFFSFNVFVDPAFDEDGKVDKTKPTCTPAKEDFKKAPIIFKMEHSIKEVAHRKLNFHQAEIKSDVAVRTCVVWNPNYSDYGVWDPTGCEVIEDTADYTKCACMRMGTYAILSEKMQPKVIKAEPRWLVILKYVLYGLSALALVIYIGVVAAAKDLKDQLHMMGANLAFALLAGSIVIVVTDFDKIANDRHMCVALGTLLHFFYGAVGLWMLFIGYASFHAVVSGIVGGRVIAYALMCWGGALLLAGVPFVAFGLNSLGTDLRCFISWDNEPKYIFFIPQVVFSGFSIFFAIVVICNLSTNAFRKENLIDDYGSFCRGASVLQILLGVTWGFGFVNYLRFGITEPDFNPIFQVLNSSCGLCLLIFIGFGSNRFRMFVLGKSKTRRKFVKAYAFGLPAAAEGEDTEYLTVKKRIQEGQ